MAFESAESSGREVVVPAPLLLQSAEAHGADLTSWSFLTGAPDAVRPVVASYGVGSVPGEEGQIDHIVATFLIDAGGRVAHRYLGLEHGADEILADLEGLGPG